MAKESKFKKDLAQLVEGVKSLSTIPTVSEMHVGVVACAEKRDVIDNTWSVSELMFFSDLEGQVSYQTHPIHLTFIENYSHLWDKLLVHDVKGA